MLTLLLIACGSDPTFKVENKTTPSFTVTNKVAVPVAKPDPRGVWSPYWDGYQWQPRWVKEGVSQPATPKATTTPTTPATVVGQASTPWPGSTPMAPTPMYALGVGILGVTDNCSPLG